MIDIVERVLIRWGRPRDGGHLEYVSRATRLTVVACIVLIAGACTVPAAHGAQRLRVVSSGDGAVTSADGKIDCGIDCSSTYHEAREITLKAVAGPGFVFAHWKGACFGVSAKCVVALSRKTRVRATFERIRRIVRLVVSGPGTVISDPRGLYCGSTVGICAASFRQGTTVRLNAVPDVNGVFHAWGGTACQGQVSTTCEFVVPGDFDLATTMFRRLFPDPGTELTVVLTGGHVTSSPPGIDCPPTCGALFASGTPVTLTAAQDMAWVAGCYGAGVTCTLIVDRRTEVHAIAAGQPPPLPQTLGLKVTVSGPGTVAGGNSYASDEIRCGARAATLRDCQHAFAPHATVRLRAIPRRGARFDRWTSPCTGTKPRCTLRLTAPKAVGAVFRRK
jgi:hypothetical protein